MSDTESQLVEYASQDLVGRIMEEHGCGPSEAMSELFSSRLYEGLSDPATGLCLQGSDYLYELLAEELGGKV